ncbi:hypothetical protein ASD04_00155 [Devosia sp. Root436]|uniref:hypothetical protein n=1 Tax=Devosia sp. Root436 TaxID=1736537 RepID=UPI0006F8F35D|nr:hypothetical protein [Devosia sp. Root436]KQX42422.1 hypothetical protein ASD04_00155 [Devosia sp. Root436]
MKLTADHLADLEAYLAKLTPRGVWATIDRDALAAHLGVRRLELARLLTKAQAKRGIVVDGDRVRFVTKAEFSPTRRKPNISRLLSVAAELVREIDEESSPQ